MEEKYVIRYYREDAYIVSDTSRSLFDEAHAAGRRDKMMQLAYIVIDTHEHKILKSRPF